MLKNKSNLILIGMPGSGKSTVGIVLAKMASKGFLDTDVLIQTEENKTLQDIVDSEGHMVLRQIEEEVVLSVNVKNHVIATGGSVPYSDKAMVHLKKEGVVLFLNADLKTLSERITNYETRGLAKKPGQSLEELFIERHALYTKYADYTIQSTGFSHEEVCADIINRMNLHLPL